MDDHMDRMAAQVRKGHLSRRRFMKGSLALGVSAVAATQVLDVATAEAQGGAIAPTRWRQGRGWGWVWGDDDEVGNLNELTPALTRKALRLAKGRVYDLGMAYDKSTFLFPGHARGEISTYRSPQGLLTQRDRPEVGTNNTLRETYASCLNSISDNAATQIDGLGHIWQGDPPRAYNDLLASDVVTDYGVIKLGVETIPPIVAPATLIDVAGFLRQNALPAGYAIGPELLQRVLRAQRVDVDPLDVALVRTGTGGIYLQGNGVGSNRSTLRKYDGAGVTLSAARWLVEEKAALMVGSDTSGLEAVPAPEQLPGGTSFNPVHIYLLIQQGVHILEFVNLQQLAQDKVYKFAFSLAPNKIKGNVAGTVQRPIAMA